MTPALCRSFIAKDPRFDRTATKQDRERRKAEARMTIVVDELWIDMHAREDREQWRHFWRVAGPAAMASAATLIALTYAFPFFI